LKNKKQKFEKPTIKDLQEITEGAMNEETAQLLLEQIEELCLIIIDCNANGQET
jgi:hypothetical protein